MRASAGLPVTAQTSISLRGSATQPTLHANGIGAHATLIHMAGPMIGGSEIELQSDKIMIATD